MSIELRRIGNRTYVTETYRVDDSVRKRHIGPLTDPAVELLYRQARLSKAEKLADRQRVEQERSVNEKIEESMDLLAQFTIWSGITTALTRRGRKLKCTRMTKSKKQTNYQDLCEHMNRSPKLRELQRLCKLADADDVSARKKLSSVIANSREIVRAMFDPIESARNLVVSSISGSQYLLSQATEERIDARIREILETGAGDPISKMRSEIAAVAWLDALRCSVAATRETDRQGDEKYTQALFDRSLRRFERAASAVQKHNQFTSRDQYYSHDRQSDEPGDANAETRSCSQPSPRDDNINV